MIETETVACDLCGSARQVLFFERREGDFTSRVVRCLDCGLLFTDPRPARDALIRMYQATYGESPEKAKKKTGVLRSVVVGNLFLRSLWHTLAGQCLGRFLRKARGKVLDVGCGTGDLLADAAARGCEGYGVEFNPESAARCRARGLEAFCGELEAAPYPPAFFDTIVFWHSLEHLPSPRRSLEKTGALLKPGGRVFVYIPNAASYMAAWAGPDWFPWHLPFHFYHYTPETLTRLAERSGFAVVGLKTATAEFSVAYTFHEISLKLGGLAGAAAKRRWYLALPARLAYIPFLRLLDLLMPGRGEFIFLELKRK